MQSNQMQCNVQFDEGLCAGLAWLVHALCTHMLTERKEGNSFHKIERNEVMTVGDL
jgi:hypothetical protein